MGKIYLEVDKVAMSIDKESHVLLMLQLLLFLPASTRGSVALRKIPHVPVQYDKAATPHLSNASDGVTVNLSSANHKRGSVMGGSGLS